MPDTTTTKQPNLAIAVSEAVRQSSFVQQRAPTQLRITCYGSSSSATPRRYLQEAHDLGYMLAQRGHVCVNGAGSFGCMAAMNDGAAAGNGHIVGVIHEMWLVEDQQEHQKLSLENAAAAVCPLQKDRSLRDGGAHAVFDGAAAATTERMNQKTSTASSNKHGGPHPALAQRLNGPIREMLVAGGKDLQERKRLLVEKAQALVVLPGGPGTFDELWEAACARNIGLQTALPIVCINIDGYYEPFRDMLQRAYDDELTKLLPEEIIHFEESAEAAIRWIEGLQDAEGKGMPQASSRLKSCNAAKVFVSGRGHAHGEWGLVVFFTPVFCLVDGEYAHLHY